jgi:hypothetical protein
MTAVTRTRAELGLLALAVALVVSGVLFDRGNCTRHEEIQLFALAAAACVAAAVGLSGIRRSWVWGTITGALIYAVLWGEWAVNADHGLN